MAKAYEQIAGITVKTLQKDADNILIKYFDTMLKQQRGADGKHLPRKAASTVKQYRKKGYDTRNWFKRTGNSVKLDIRKTLTGITAQPRGYNTLKYVPMANDFYTLNAQIQQDILNLIKENL